MVWYGARIEDRVQLDGSGVKKVSRPATLLCPEPAWSEVRDIATVLAARRLALQIALFIWRGIVSLDRAVSGSYAGALDA